MKAFAKTPRKILTVTIDENGDLVYLKTDSCDALLELGETVTKRASHVEPDNFLLRRLFHTLRLFGDKNRIADWTRNWNCLWRVNTSPVGGPILLWRHVWGSEDWMKGLSGYNYVALWRNRQSAIDAEIKFLNDWFLTR